jgi:hypothetical protein
LDRKKIAAGIDPTSCIIPDYNFKRADSGKEVRDSGDVNKAILIAKNTAPIIKRP